MAKALFKNTVLCLHFIAMAVLIGITAWDVWNIVDGFNTENVLTVVKPEVSNETFRHLEGERIRYDLTTMNPIILPQYWASTTAMIKQARNNASTLIADPNYFLQKNSSSLSDMDLMALTTLMTEIACLDLSQKDCTGKSSQSYCDKTIFRCGNIDNTDRFLKNSTLINGLQEILWNRIRPSLIRLDQEGVQPAVKWTSAVQLISLGNTSAYIEIDPSKLLDTHTTRVRLLLGHIADMDLMENGSGAGLPTLDQIYLRTPQYTTEKLTITPKSGAQILVNIANSGIFDKRRTTECTYDPIIHIREETIGSWKMNECDVYQYLSKIPQVCHCVPFTYRKELEKFSAYQKYKDLPFCTDSVYQNCSVELREAVNNAKIACPPKCITVKNQYQVSVKTGIQPDDLFWYGNVDFAVCSSATLEIECKDPAYVLYEERYQLSTFQLVSQIGGDIGLYTGISMFGIWQLIVLVFLWCHKEKGQKPAPEEIRKKWSVLPLMDMLLRESGLNFGLKGEQAEIQIQGQANPNITIGTASHEEHFNVIIARLEKMEQEFGRVIENLMKDQVSKWMEQAFDGHMQKFISHGQESDGVTRRRNISQHPNAVQEDIQ